MWSSGRIERVSRSNYMANFVEDMAQPIRDNKLRGVNHMKETPPADLACWFFVDVEFSEPAYAWY
jgi:hypothetical protein